MGDAQCDDQRLRECPSAHSGGAILGRRDYARHIFAGNASLMDERQALRRTVMKIEIAQEKRSELAPLFRGLGLLFLAGLIPACSYSKSNKTYTPPGGGGAPPGSTTLLSDQFFPFP